ncbi:hypothetical protein GGR54DRAFT_47755 [Hypoxylon sp. NC1633]|nr:hypothetical protein GGR54DRAFT_47755 [Hypoxylon sp. NC1633]
MMPSLMGVSMPHIPPQNYPSGPTFDELSRQLTLSDSMRRISRSSAGQQRTAGSMRIAKPSSASNSPQAMMARRRTMMNDNNVTRRRQHALDHAVMAQMQDCTSYSTPEDPVKRNSRPVSWHPTTHIQQQQHMHITMPQPDFSQYVIPAPTPYHQTDIYSGYQNLPPTPAVYSGQTSPISTVSPLCLPYSASSQPHASPAYISRETWNPAPQYVPSTYTTSESPGGLEAFPSFADQASFHWDGLASQGFSVCTAPPTPDEFQPAQQTQPTVTPEESIPYQPLEDSEEEGEILVGMGLYDQPSKAETDPGLVHYRTTTTQLLGTTYRGRGQGWKLEEAWEPPATDDEDDEGDGDGEEDEEDDAEKDRTTKSTTAQENWI